MEKITFEKFGMDETAAYIGFFRIKTLQESMAALIHLFPKCDWELRNLMESLDVVSCRLEENYSIFFSLPDWEGYDEQDYNDPSLLANV